MPDPVWNVNDTWENLLRQILTELQKANTTLAQIEANTSKGKK